MQVTELTGLEAGELRAKVGSNVTDNTVVSLTGTDIELAPHLRHAGTLACCHIALCDPYGMILNVQYLPKHVVMFIFI